jgi:hypothetical protein
MSASLRAAHIALAAALNAADAWHTEALAALPDGHTWRDVDLLSIEKSKRHMTAYGAYDVVAAEFDRLVAEEMLK